MEIFEGGCHCKAVRFRVRLAHRRALECNCSVCSMKGYLHLIVGGDALEVLQGEAALETYRFGTGVARHHFCRSCGVHPFYVPRSHPEGFSVNLRCLDDVDLDGFEIRPFDGRNWEARIDEIR